MTFAYFEPTLQVAFMVLMAILNLLVMVPVYIV